MANLAAHLRRAIRAAAVPVEDVSIGSDTDKGTWRVHPPALQAAAQPIIDAFNPNDPQHVEDDLSGEVKVALDQQRLSSAIVWTILKQMFPTDTDAQTRTKYGVARTRIIEAFKSEVWK